MRQKGTLLPLIDCFNLQVPSPVSPGLYLQVLSKEGG